MEKVLPPLYQHPFVDVFSKFKLFEDSQITKEGDVTQTIDKKLGKKIYKIQGATSASNYFLTPCKKAKYKSLGLTGRYNYIIMKTQVGKNFSTHLDFIVNDKNLCRISLSNMFKETKVTGSSIQIPLLEIEPQKWSVVQINIFSILEDNEMFSKSLEEKKFYLRSFQICSNQFIRGIATSDIEYNVTNFPKELSLKCKASQDWYKEYSWMAVGKIENAEADPDLLNKSKRPKSVPKSKRPKSSLRNNKSAKKNIKNEGLKSRKKVAFKLQNDEPTKDNVDLNDQVPQSKGPNFENENPDIEINQK